MSKSLETIWGACLREEARRRWGVDLDAAEFAPVMEPAPAGFGDATTSVAFKLARVLRRPPPEIARETAAALEGAPYVARVEVARGGYVNVTAQAAYFEALVRDILEQGAQWGRGPKRPGRVLVEFVSANPTGPLHVAHARQAAMGDALARILSFAGFHVEREFYINDTGRQIEHLGRSVLWRLAERLGRSYSVDERNAYHGEYIRDLAREADPAWLDAADGVDRAARFAKDRMLAAFRRDLEEFRVRFDHWTSQEALEGTGVAGRVVEDLERAGAVERRDGAVWFRAQERGDTQDWVLVRSDGTFTYRTPDFAYHLRKYARGFDALIDFWGPDHKAHAATMRIALRTLLGEAIGDWTDWLAGRTKRAFHVVMPEHCRVLRAGREEEMSKRAGTMVTLRELLDDVGADPMRWFLSARKAESHLDFDVELAKKQTLDNPVFYVQYAHTRICSVVRKAREEGWVDAAELQDETTWRGPWQGPLGEPEIALVRAIRAFPFGVERAAARLDPSLLTQFAYDAASAYQGYYTDHRVLVEDEGLRRMRLAVSAAVQSVLRSALDLLGVSAPQAM